ncbi:YjbR protein [Sphingobacterium allocomposti]|uniref:YjbR protein n=2 Tax=Sphingobacterium allocomposti TaxID=415956 RepID=A0A5S5CZX0_9SPHI|nr:YjbR protein [Sphingobacterium composti Yoo et al. 2007 non Ten et al. 2007]
MPFSSFFRNSRAILVFYNENKMFCLFDIERFDSCTIKCSPDEIPELKERYSAVGPPFNLSHKHWIKISFNDDMSDQTLLSLIYKSYLLVSQSKKIRDKR